MTPAQTRKLVCRYYDAFNARDVDGMIACLSKGFVHDVNEGVRRRGKAKFREFLEHMNRCYQERLTHMIIMCTPDGSRAAAEFTVSGHYVSTAEGLPAATGQPYRLPGGAFFALKEDGIARVTTYYNLRDWVTQVTREPAG